MVSSILSDFCRVLFFPKDKEYLGKLNPLHRDYAGKFGLDYPILEHFEFNMPLIDFMQSLRGSIKLDIYTTDVIQKHPDLAPHLEIWFDSVHAVNDYGLSKKNPEAFTFIANKLGRPVDSFVFIDDTLENVTAARVAGMKGVLFENTEQAIADTKKALVG